LLISGIPSLLMMPILPRLLGSVDARFMVITGLLLFAVSCFLDTTLTGQSAGNDFFYSQLLRGAGQIMAMMPLNQASMAAVSNEEAADAAGLYNMMRNLGGSVGLALMGVFIDRQNKLHSDIISESVTANSPLAQSRLSENTALFASQHGDMLHAKMQALGQLANEINLQAAVMTYSESFYVLGIALMCCIPLALLLRAPRLTHK
jgi:DHA2 family multidrug resistance protein